MAPKVNEKDVALGVDEKTDIQHPDIQDLGPSYLSESDLLAEGEDRVVVLDPAVLGVVIDPAHLHPLLPVRLGQVVLTNLTIVNR